MHVILEPLLHHSGVCMGSVEQRQSRLFKSSSSGICSVAMAVYMRDPEDVQRKRDTIIEDGGDNLQVSCVWMYVAQHSSFANHKTQT